jgi:hypothetical protein
MPALLTVDDGLGSGARSGLRDERRSNRGYGVHGDPLPQGKLDLPELLESPTDAEWTWARAFIAGRRWREAVTYRNTAPHEYTIREWEPDEESVADFEQFAGFVRRFGRADFFYKVRHLYWSVDEFKYWTMGWPIAETVVINRARLNAPEPWKTKEDQ